MGSMGCMRLCSLGARANLLRTNCKDKPAMGLLWGVRLHQNKSGYAPSLATAPQFVFTTHTHPVTAVPQAAM